MALNIDVERAQVVDEIPPRPKRKGHGRAPSKKYRALAELCRENAGSPVFIGSAEERLQAQALAFRIRKGKSTAFLPVGDFEAECRFNEETGETDVYVTFVGDVDAVHDDEVDEDVADSDDDDWGDDN